MTNGFLPACSQQTAVCEAPPPLDPLGRLVPQQKGEQNRDGAVIWYAFDSGNTKKWCTEPYGSVETELIRRVFDEKTRLVTQTLPQRVSAVDCFQPQSDAHGEYLRQQDVYVGLT